MKSSIPTTTTKTTPTTTTATPMSQKLPAMIQMSRKLRIWSDG